MKSHHVFAMCLVCFFITSCNVVDNEFIIHDPENVASSAELRLCGRRLQLDRDEGVINGTMPITCEGGGDILVLLSEGGETECHIGYVTPGAVQVFEFAIEDRQCRSTRSQQ